MIDIIYSYLLQSNNQYVHDYIFINEIGEDLDEVILKMGGTVHINVRDLEYNNTNKNDNERKIHMLEIINAGLIRIAEKYKKLDVNIIHEIKRKVLENDFSFEFLYKEFSAKTTPALIGQVLIKPTLKYFEVMVLVQDDNKVKCKIPIYYGMTLDSYLSEFFSKAKWKNNALLISGKNKEVTVHVYHNECKIDYVNNSNYAAPPLFELYKAKLTVEEREMAYKDWMHSLPPAVAAIIEMEGNS